MPAIPTLYFHIDKITIPDSVFQAGASLVFTIADSDGNVVVNANNLGHVVGEYNVWADNAGNVITFGASETTISTLLIDTAHAGETYHINVFTRILNSEFEDAVGDVVEANPALNTVEAVLKGLRVDDKEYISPVYVIEATTTDGATFTCSESKNTVIDLLAKYPVVLLHLIFDNSGTKVDYGVYEHDIMETTKDVFKKVMFGTMDTTTMLMVETNISFNNDNTKTISSDQYTFTISPVTP